MNAVSTLSLHQRAKGRAHVALRPRLHGLHQSGSAKAIVLDGREVVFLNTSGGLTGGDTLAYGLVIENGARVTATTQTAERVYRSTTGAAQIGLNFTVGAGCHLDWLPQETILFDASHAKRRTEINLGAGATCLMAETVTLGRAAMGEAVTRCDFHDWRQISRAGKPLHLEALRLTDASLAPRAALLAGARAVSTVVLISPEAEAMAARIAPLLPHESMRAAASCLPGRLVIRLMAGEAWPLRQHLAQLLCTLRGAPLPRVWQI